MLFPDFHDLLDTPSGEPAILNLYKLQSRDYDQNLRYAGDKAKCLLCGREVDEATAKSVHLLVMGRLIATDRDDYEYSLGFHLVGADCARRLPAAFLF